MKYFGIFVLLLTVGLVGCSDLSPDDDKNLSVLNDGLVSASEIRANNDPGIKIKVED